MRDKIADKLPIFVCFRIQCKLALVGLIILSLAACATTGSGDSSESGDSTRADPTVEPLLQADGELDSELLFHILAAERLGAVGDHEEALGHFLEATRLSDDPDLARQVISLSMRLQNWAAMAEGADRWRELAPDEQAPLQYGVLALVNLGHIDEASEWLATLIQNGEHEADSWRDAMLLLAATSSDEAALATLDRLVEQYGDALDRSEILINRSFLNWQLGRSDEALALALLAVEQGGEREEFVWAAQLAVAEGDLDSALELYSRALEAEPDSRSLALAKAEVLRQLDMQDEAVTLLQTLPPDGEVLYSLGSYLYQAERLEEATDVWNELAALEEVDDPTHHAFLVAFLAELLGQYDQALHWYEQVQDGRNLNRAKMRRAILEGERGNVPAARELLDAVRSGSDQVLATESLLVEAEILRENDQPEQAVQLLSSALRDQPNDISLLYTRAICAVAMDDLELAEQDFRRILQIDDDNAMALNALGYTLTDRTDRHQEAYRLIRRALALEPESPPILDSMGWVYFRLGQPERALPYLEQAHAGEDNPEIAAHLGEVLWELGREEEARLILDQTRDSHPDDQYLIDTLERLGLTE